ncbi:hypothetical protein BKA70DRAFT_1301903 [Coprinopsis sp. MPI-PUGE-AT-0042]|nr:hypothetical protein BKA70DRAFT_1301903 [Coprinopsis sp. MPI-PUGE-AT-0042]
MSVASGTNAAADQKTSVQLPSACMQVISNQELIHMIFGMLRDSLNISNVEGVLPSKTPLWQKELRRLLFVNKSFFETTVEFLWQTMYSLLPVFSLVPSFKAEDTGYTFDGTHSAEWGRFQFYAAQIRHFVFEVPCPFEQLPEHWLTFLLRKSAGTPLFPSLKTISSSFAARGGIRLLPAALYATLAATLARYPDWESSSDDPIEADPMSGLMAAVASFAAALRSLRYRGPITKGVIRSISGLSELTELDLTITSYNDVCDVYKLNRLSNLRKLKFLILSSWGPDDLNDITVKPSPSTSLPSLRCLEVVSTSWDMAALTQVIAPPALITFRSQIVEVDSNIYLTKLTEFITLNNGLVNLAMTLSTDELSGHEWAEAGQEAYLTALSRSIKGGKLVHLDITGLHFSGPFVQRAYASSLKSEANTRLELFRFSLPGELSFEGDERYFATADTLQDLALKGCKNLKTLELHFQDDSFSQAPLLPTQKSTHPLQYLSIITFVDDEHLDYSVRHKIAIAVFLDRLFPSLVKVDGTATALWEDVNALVESYQASRRQN